MKLKTTLLVFLMFVFGSLMLQAQQPAIDCQFVALPDQSASTGQYCASIQVRSVDGADFLGSSSIRFMYNPDVMTFNGSSNDGVMTGSYTSINFDFNDGMDLDNPPSDECTFIPPGLENPVSPYSEHGFDGLVPGDFIVTFVLLQTTSFGSPVACPDIIDEWEEVAHICFDVVNADGDPNLMFAGTQNGEVVDLTGTNFNDHFDDPTKYYNGTFTGLNISFNEMTGGGGGDCEANAGTTNFDSIEEFYCGTADLELLAEGFTVTDSEGENHLQGIVITDADSIILDVILGGMATVTLDEGTYIAHSLNLPCSLIEGLGFDCEAPPLELLIGLAAGDFLGLADCFDLVSSNVFAVLPADAPECAGGGDCEADAGNTNFSTIEEFYCGAAELELLAEGFTVTNSEGENHLQGMVVTDADSVILEVILGGMATVTLDEGAYIVHSLNLPCSLIEGLGFDCEAPPLELLIGLAAGDFLALADCFDLVSSIAFDVLPADAPECAECLADGGTISTESATTVVSNDGIPDVVTVTLEGNVGENYAYVITNEDATIMLNGPLDGPDFDFEGAPPGVCLIWGLAYDGEVTLGAPNEALSIEGDCFSLSNPIAVTREAEDTTCNASGGIISTMSETTFCVNDSIPDEVVVDLADNTGENYVYLITNEDASILLAGPLAGPLFSFDMAPPGICLIWGLAYDGEVVISGEGEPLSIEGDCFSLSNPITVTREDCNAELLDITNFEIVQDDATQTYIVTFSVEGGSGVYSSAQGTFEGINFTGSPIACGEPYSITVVDATTGVTQVVEGIYVCETTIECMANAGLLNTDEIQDIYCAEDGAALNVTSGTFQDGADYAQVYVLTLDNTGFTIVDLNTTGNFASPAPGTYIFHALNMLAADVPADPSQLIGLDAVQVLGTLECFDLMTATSSFTILTLVSITGEYDCDETTGVYSVVYGFSGGMPEYAIANNSTNPDDYVYTVIGDVNGEYDSEESITVEYGDNTSYTVTAMDAMGCTATLFETPAPCIKDAIELLSFEGTTLDRANELTWATASEIDNAFFTLERSTDGMNFEPIAKIDGAINSTSINTYAFLDETFTAAINYYRLTSTDLSGVTEVAPKVIRLERTVNHFEIIKVAPVPAIDFVNVRFNIPNQQEIDVQVFDIAGKLIMQQEFEAYEGTNVFRFNVTSYAAGTYFIKMTDGSVILTEKFVK